MKNLKWIRQPNWENMPEDIDAFFAQDPKSTPEFATKSEKLEEHHHVNSDENPLIHEEGNYGYGSGRYHDEYYDA